MRTGFLITFLILLSLPGYNQVKKRITLNDIWKQRKFNASSIKGINWMKKDKYYSSLDYDKDNGEVNILKYRIKSGKVTDTILKGKEFTYNDKNLGIEDYTFSPDEEKILLVTHRTSVYRYSSKSHYYIYDISESKITKLDTSGIKQKEATFSPKGDKIAYVKNQDLFYKDLEKNKIIRVTNNGSKGKIINGHTDWVYEEEFQFTKAFFWSPEGDKLAYYVFHEERVPGYEVRYWKDLYPEDVPVKYPKAGEKNAIVDIKVYHLPNDKKVNIDIGKDTNQYIHRVMWTKNNNKLSIRRMNRLQNTLEIIHANPDNGNSKVILKEESDTYIDINDDLTYLKGGKYFIYTSDKSGYKHIYLYEMDGDLKRQITKGNWEVDKIEGVDEEQKNIYYTSTEMSSLQRHFYRIGYGKNPVKKRLTSGKGVHKIDISKGYEYFMDYYSNSQHPRIITLKTCKSGKKIKIYENNKALEDTLNNYNLGKKQFLQIPNRNGNALNAFIIKPPDFDSSKKYPVMMNVYGGPGSQLVMRRWGGANYIWHQMLAQKGYIVVGVDNRGTGGRGTEFQKCTYGQLGKLETRDQVEAAKYLGNLDYVDSSRIGIWGWSYGGYMTCLCMTKGAEQFSTGVAVAPVTNWRFYDTIYTERYLKTPQKNPEGYKKYSPVNHAGKLEGNLLLVHGMSDDNVHLQNTLAMKNALIKEGKSFQSFLYPNRDHAIYGGNARYHLYKKMTNFIINNL